MRHNRKLVDAFGKNEHDLVDLPTKISNIQIARLLVSEVMGGRSYCFPHGIETSNSVYEKHQRNWKKHRKSRWK